MPVKLTPALHRAESPLTQLCQVSLASAANVSFPPIVMDAALITELHCGLKADHSCHELAKVAKGQTLQYALGGTFRVLKVSNLKLVSSSDTQVTCRAKALFSDGRDRQLTYRVWEVEGERFYEFSSG